MTLMPMLDWIGKSAVVDHHRKVPYHLLRCDRKLSAGDADAGNLLSKAITSWLSKRCCRTMPERSSAFN